MAELWRVSPGNIRSAGFVRQQFGDAAPSVVASEFWPTAAGIVILAPTTGSVDVTGYAPRISLRLVPGTGDINITGYAPAIRTGTRLSPGTGHIDVTGYAPTVDYPREEQPAGGNSGLYRRPRADDYLPPLERERVLRPASAAGVLVRGYAPTLRRSVRISEEVDIDIPDEVLAMALELLEEWETA
jgi:hypothetical protein